MPATPADFPAQTTDEAVKKAAKTQAQSIPGWATWDEATALQWIADHFTGPLAAIPDEAAIDAMSGAAFQAAAKDIIADQRAVLDDMETAFRALARFVIAMRNEVWPELQD